MSIDVYLYYHHGLNVTDSLSYFSMPFFFICWSIIYHKKKGFVSFHANFTLILCNPQFWLYFYYCFMETSMSSILWIKYFSLLQHHSLYILLKSLIILFIKTYVSAVLEFKYCDKIYKQYSRSTIVLLVLISYKSILEYYTGIFKYTLKGSKQFFIYFKIAIETYF